MTPRFLLLAAVLLALTRPSLAGAPLEIQLTQNGVQSLTYHGTEYCDPTGAGALGFTGDEDSGTGNVWAPGVLDANKGKDAFPVAPAASAVNGDTVTRTYPWGTLRATYSVKGEDLYVTATITNSSTTPIGWWKANLLQLNSRLLFDNRPWGQVMPFGYTPNMHYDYHWWMWGMGSNGYETWNFTDPHVYWWVDSAAPFDSAPVEILFADLDPKWQTGVYHVKTGHGDAWPVEGSADGDPGRAPLVAPGASDTAHMVIRFRQESAADFAAVQAAQTDVAAKLDLEKTAAGNLKAVRQNPDLGDGYADAKTAAQTALDAAHTNLAQARATESAAEQRARPDALAVCADGYEAFGRAYPRTVKWTDRRPIGTYFGCRGNAHSATNPNGWFNDPSIDTTTPEGRAAFATRLLADVDATITTLTATGAQGVVWWDVEGERWPQPTTYIGDPRVLDPAYPQHDQFAPELDTPVTYDGKQMPVVDACFLKWHDAGFKTGLTVRPDTLTWTGRPKQTSPPGSSADSLLNKITYARDRWGCTLFYLDSMSDWFGNFWMEKTVAKYPDILLMPEWGRTRSYRHSSPFSYTQFTGFYRGCPPEMQACWPDAFCCMSNVDFAHHYDDALYGVQHGNLLMFPCWYPSPESKAVKKIYVATGVKHIPWAVDENLVATGGAAVQVKLTATDEDGSQLTYKILGPPAHGKLGVLDVDSGTVPYVADKAYMGTDAFSFVAVDATGLRSNRGMVEITTK